MSKHTRTRTHTHARARTHTHTHTHNYLVSEMAELSSCSLPSKSLSLTPMGRGEIHPGVFGKLSMAARKPVQWHVRQKTYAYGRVRHLYLKLVYDRRGCWIHFQQKIKIETKPRNIYIFYFQKSWKKMIFGHFWSILRVIFMFYV